MFKSKYSMALTIFLVLIIIAIIVIGIIMSIRAYKNYEEDKEKKKVYAELIEGNSDEDEDEEEKNTIEDNIIGTPVENTVITDNTNSNGGNGTRRARTKFYKEYPMVGYIKIEKTKVDYPILLDVSPGALETAVGVLYPNNPKLNQPGITVIIGHNYRNGKFFSNNKKLEIGDKIKIKNLSGKTLTYSIYEIQTLLETDADYISKDRGNNIEIALSTCTDDGTGRLVILARAD